MQQITVDKDELITILKKNKIEHQKLYDNATIGYHKEVIEKLAEALDKAETGTEFITNLRLDKPEHHIKEYDKIIGMLELSNENEIVLLPHEYDQYVVDEWQWAQHTKSLNNMYASKVKF